MNLRLFRPVNPAISDGFCVRAPVSPRTPLMLHCTTTTTRAGGPPGGRGWAAAGSLTREVNSASSMYSSVRAVRAPISVGSAVISVFWRPSRTKLVRAPNSDGSDVILRCDRQLLTAPPHTQKSGRTNSL